MESDWRWNRYAWPWHHGLMELAAQLQDDTTTYLTVVPWLDGRMFQTWETVDGSQTWRNLSNVYELPPNPFPTDFFGPVMPDHP